MPFWPGASSHEQRNAVHLSLQSHAVSEHSGERREARAQTHSGKMWTTILQHGTSPLRWRAFTTSGMYPVLIFNKVYAASDKVRCVEQGCGQRVLTLWLETWPSEGSAWSAHSFPTFPPWLWMWRKVRKTRHCVCNRSCWLVNARRTWVPCLHGSKSTHRQHVGSQENARM